MYSEYLSFFGVDIEMLKRLLCKALSKGGDFADIFFEYSISKDFTLKESKVNSAGSHIDYGVGIRVLKGEQTGYSYSESTAYTDMENAALTAAAIADSSVTHQDIVQIKEIGYKRYYSFGNELDKMENSSLIDYMICLDARMREREPMVQKVAIKLMCSQDKILYFNSLGEITADSGPVSSIILNALLHKGSDSRMTASTRSFRMGSEMFTDQIAIEMVEDIVKKGNHLFNAKEIKGGIMPVVMGAGGSGILLHEAIGHAFEADFNRKGISIFHDKLGKKICRDNISVVDDGTLPYNRGSINIDDEGVPGQKTYMVRNGVLESFLHDRISAAHYGVKTTGNGRRESFRYPPIPRMRATYMENGDSDPESIIKSVKFGLYAEEFSNGQVQIGAGDFTFYVTSGYMIENGKLTYPVRDVNVIGNGPKALADIEAVGNDSRMENGTWICGKEQYVPVSCGMPTVLVSSLSVGGSAI
ncbi:MAG: TldD/PmbA family protein [Bacteroidales bacterium]|nr:TldD/PmbA family protein [Bacteroidales bacterium]